MRAIGFVLLVTTGVAMGQARPGPAAVDVAWNAVAWNVDALNVDTSVGSALRNLAERAGVVFVGQVVAVERKGGVVEVRFSVQQAIQGTVGLTYTLREWAGLWVGGQRRYAIGQRAMWFLHAPNAAGLSSPVDGMEGIVPLVPMGADADPLLDVRRLATRVRRQMGQSLGAEAASLKGSISDITTSNQSYIDTPVRMSLPPGWKPMPVKVLGRPSMSPGERNAAR